MIKIPHCCVCEHFFKNNEVNCCKAFPDGIPQAHFWGSIENSPEHCNNNIGYSGPKFGPFEKFVSSKKKHER